MDNCKKFSDLTVRLQALFKSASYSESTVKDMDFILRAFTSYMNANGMDEYSPEIGENMIRYCEETLKVCDSRVSRAKGIVAKLNRLYQGLDGEEALYRQHKFIWIYPNRPLTVQWSNGTKNGFHRTIQMKQHCHWRRMPFQTFSNSSVLLFEENS